MSKIMINSSIRTAGSTVLLTAGLTFFMFFVGLVGRPLIEMAASVAAY